MATLTPTLNDHGYKNWVKGGLALKFSREGIENLVETNIDKFHQNILASLPAGPLCYNCSTENIVQCNKNNNFCRFNKNNCLVHDVNNPSKKSRPCPTAVCNVVRDKILKQHRFHGPSWKNTDSSRWCREPWQLATCYMSAGYTASTSAAQTDLPGLLSVVINNKIFDTEVTDDLSNKSNVFCRARDARNSILHNVDMRLSDADLAAHITTLDKMLADAKCLSIHPSAIQARALLQQLLNGTIHVTTRHEAEVLAEALRSIDDKQVKAIAAVNKEKDDAKEVIKADKDNVLAAVNKEKYDAKEVIKAEKDNVLAAVTKEKDEAKEVIKAEKDNVLAAVNKEKDDAKEVIKAEKDNVLAAVNKEKDEAKTVIKAENDNVLAAVNKEKDDAKDVIKAEKDDALEAIVANLQKALHEAHRVIKQIEAEVVGNIQRISTDSYDKIKQDLKAELLSIYQDGEHLYTPLSPIDPSEDKHIDELYVPPDMKRFDYEKDKGAQPRQQTRKGTAPDMNPKEREGKAIETYKDIFKEGNKKIYVVGEAGTGKTSFCQKMMSTWCQVQTEQIEQLSDDQQAMAKFDFLFYISLRDETTRSCVDEMIKHSLLPNKARLHEPLLVSKVLEEERCLVILDGLDEWTTENKTASPSHINKGIPGRDSIRNCSVITTTRPWKLEVLQLKSSQIDTKVELLGIDKISSESLIQKIIIHLNDKHNSNKMYADFILEIEEKQLLDFLTIPVILKQLVCLWHLGKELGTTKCTIYSQMLELLLELALNRLKTDYYFQNEKEEWVKSTIKLPSCFSRAKTCQDFKPLLFVLAKLAFLTLFSDDQESSLVFKSTKAGCYHLSQAEVNICLKIGILCQNKILRDCVSPLKQISFLHKTYQEFLAAVFVSLDLSNSKKYVKQIQKICNNDVVVGEMSNVLTFISGICTSDLTCELLAHFNKHYKSAQSFLLECIREGYTCSHRSGLFGRRGKHLYIDNIDIIEPSQYLEQLCEINIPNIKELTIHSPPTAQCLQYLLQIHKLNELYILPQSDSSISEDLLYDLIHHLRHTLRIISIDSMTLKSNTRLSTLLPRVQHLWWLYIGETTLPQQLLTSIYALNSSPPYRSVNIMNPTILPDTQSTD